MKTEDGLGLEKISENDVIERKDWPYRLGPRGDKYRVSVKGVFFRKYTIESFYNGRWVELFRTDLGVNTRWVRLSASGSWSLAGITRLRDELEDPPELLEDLPEARYTGRKLKLAINV